MNGLSHIQENEDRLKAAKDNLPLGLMEAGGVGGNVSEAQLLRPEGNSCPELWNYAEALFLAATKEPDKKEHHRKLMEAGQAFAAVVLAAGHFPIEKSFALNNLGLIMQGLNHMDKAEQCFAFALQLNPKHGTILANFATVRMVKGDLKGADEWFYKALERNPKCAEARWNAGLIALMFGDFRRGFINYEWRWRCSAFTWRALKTSRPQWKGQDLKGKTILLTHEQGFGDSIMFIRYAKMVKALGPAKVRYLCLPQLLCILSDVEGIDSVTEYQDMNRDGSAGDEDFDYHCPLLSLPRIFKTRVDTVPWDGAYIKSRDRVSFGMDKNYAHPFQLTGDHQFCALCSREQMHPIHQHPIQQQWRIGIVWSGRKDHANDKNRSMSLEQFAPLFDVPGIRWYSLQVGERAKDLESGGRGETRCPKEGGDKTEAGCAAGGFPDSAERRPPHSLLQKIYAPPLNTFLDTAWWLYNLDLLISVDTAVVHLAGAMARPVWTLLPHSGDWRWMMEREDTPWYPTMRLFRQKEKGNWAEVIERVKGELCKLQRV